VLILPDWRTGQTIYVLEGLGLCQRRGGPIDVIPLSSLEFFFDLE
jgi:hypothetical protein